VRHFLVAAAALALAAATATVAAPKPIYQVDSVSAKTVGRNLIVTASGAVNSGGWTSPHLRLSESHKPESDTEVFEFVASPPPPGTVVVQTLLPVTASATLALPTYGVVQVKVIAESNSVTTPIR
jgi:hypothetical protein